MFNSFLRHDLKVEEGNITLLRSEQATRKGILDALETLIGNENIQNGDTILIFFAGHGSRAPAPEGWKSSDGRIEFICPHDIGALQGDATDVGGGKRVEAIPDRTLSALFRRLARQHGDNIVRSSRVLPFQLINIPHR